MKAGPPCFFSILAGLFREAVHLLAAHLATLSPGRLNYALSPTVRVYVCVCICVCVCVFAFMYVRVCGYACVCMCKEAQ